MKAALRYSRQASRRAFSLLELLVAVGLLSVIVLALYSMFDQTQKALHANIGQVDVMESGRLAMDLIVRDLERAQSPRPSLGADLPKRATNINFAVRKTTFLRGIGAANQGAFKADEFPPGMTDALHRDYPLNEAFFLTPLSGNQWTAVGYFVANPENATLPPNEGLGTLYRYQDQTNDVARGSDAAQRFFWFYQYTQNDDPFVPYRRAKNSDFLNPAYRTNKLNSTRLIDNVLFFRVLPFASGGIPVDANLILNLDPTPKYPKFFTNSFASGIIMTNSHIGLVDDATKTAFTGSAMPSAVEVELGVLSPRLFTQYTNQVNLAQRANFLTKHAADILIFRQRIPLRTALQ